MVDSKQFHAAEVQFALGNHGLAASMLPPIQFRRPVVGVGSRGDNSPLLLMTGQTRYEPYLLLAYQQAARGEWASSISAFRLALALGPAYFLEQDHRQYFEVLGNHYAERASGNPNTIDTLHLSYLAGKYYLRAGQINKADTWLQRVRNSSAWLSLSTQEQARTWLYSGQIEEQLSRTATAHEAYASAIRTAPDLIEAHVALMSLAIRDKKDDIVKSQIASLSFSTPSYSLGRSGENYQLLQPAVTSTGWQLLGYDLDEESLDNGGLVDVWLWWRAPSGEPSIADTDMLHIGDRWLQRQMLLNLAPNSGFEWTQTDETLPVGYMQEFYGATNPNIYVVASDRLGLNTNALVIQNNLSRRVGITTSRQPMEAGGVYLMAGWKRDSGNGNIGRLCRSSTAAESPYYIADYKSGEPRDTWIHFAAISVASTINSVTTCRLFLLNYESDGLVTWDSLLFARLRIPR
jgi:tetratricopeptide (TPR) repeat protein